MNDDSSFPAKFNYALCCGNSLAKWKSSLSVWLLKQVPVETGTTFSDEYVYGPQSVILRKVGVFLVQMNECVIAYYHFAKIYQKHDNKMESTADFDQVSFIEFLLCKTK